MKPAFLAGDKRPIVCNSAAPTVKVAMILVTKATHIVALIGGAVNAAMKKVGAGLVAKSSGSVGNGSIYGKVSVREDNNKQSVVKS